MGNVRNNEDESPLLEDLQSAVDVWVLGSPEDVDFLWQEVVQVSLAPFLCLVDDLNKKRRSEKGEGKR